MTPKITPAAANDVPALRDMIRALCAYHGDPCPLGLEETQATLVNGPLVALIAKIGGAPVGYAAMERHWRPMFGGWSWDIIQHYVTEAQRSRGVGRALIGACRERARAMDAVGLTIGTAPENKAAVSAYLAMGLEERPGGGTRFRVPL